MQDCATKPESAWPVWLETPKTGLFDICFPFLVRPGLCERPLGNCLWSGSCIQTTESSDGARPSLIRIALFTRPTSKLCSKKHSLEALAFVLHCLDVYKALKKCKMRNRLGSVFSYRALSRRQLPLLMLIFLVSVPLRTLLLTWSCHKLLDLHIHM